MNRNNEQAKKAARGQPEASPLHVGGPNIGDREVFDRLVDGIFERRWFTNDGVVVKQFESMLCEYVGVKHCIPVCNATVGLQLACQALNLSGEIILPAFTFVATPHAVQWEGLTPVFADIDPESHTLCPRSVESLITDRTSAILGVHLWGNPCDTDRLEQLAAKHQLEVLYDAAHALGCGHNKSMIGNFGRCEVFSFHATKFFNTFEGGAIATNDDELAKKIRLMKNFGFAAMDKVVHLGTNAKMTEICAAMGISMFACLNEILQNNRSNYLLYRKLLQQIPGVKHFSLEHLDRTNWQYIVVEIDENRFGASRDAVFDQLHANNIRARRYFFPGCHEMEPYKSVYGNQPRDLPHTEQLCKTVLCLPTGSCVNESDVKRVCAILRATPKQSVGGPLRLHARPTRRAAS